MPLYNIFTTSQGLRITKWDSDFNVESSYLVSDQGCECPAQKPCKHMTLMRRFRLTGMIDENDFLDDETNQHYELNQ